MKRPEVKDPPDAVLFWSNGAITLIEDVDIGTLSVLMTVDGEEVLFNLSFHWREIRVFQET